MITRAQDIVIRGDIHRTCILWEEDSGSIGSNQKTIMSGTGFDQWWLWRRLSLISEHLNPSWVISELIFEHKRISFETISCASRSGERQFRGWKGLIRDTCACKFLGFNQRQSEPSICKNVELIFWSRVMTSSSQRFQCTLLTLIRIQRSAGNGSQSFFK